jgi:hypothetical protein
MTAAADAIGIVHRVWTDPIPFSTRSGGMAGQTDCGLLFYDAKRGALSCTFPNAVPLGRSAEQVTCMACVAKGSSR